MDLYRPFWPFGLHLKSFVHNILFRSIRHYWLSVFRWFVALAKESVGDESTGESSAPRFLDSFNLKFNAWSRTAAPALRNENNSLSHSSLLLLFSVGQQWRPTKSGTLADSNPTRTRFSVIIILPLGQRLTAIKWIVPDGGDFNRTTVFFITYAIYHRRKSHIVI